MTVYGARITTRDIAAAKQFDERAPSLPTEIVIDFANNHVGFERGVENQNTVTDPVSRGQVGTIEQFRRDNLNGPQPSNRLLSDKTRTKHHDQSLDRTA